jgi:hypothetical protein
VTCLRAMPPSVSHFGARRPSTAIEGIASNEPTLVAYSVKERGKGKTAI